MGYDDDGNNNTISTADPITLDNGYTSFYGNIGADNGTYGDDFSDVDLYKIDLEAGDRLVLIGSHYAYYFDEWGNWHPDGAVRLFNSSGEELVYQGPLNGFYLDQRIETSGSYYIGMSSDSRGGYDPTIDDDVVGRNIGTGNYYLSISRYANEAPVAVDDTVSAIPVDSTVISKKSLIGENYWSNDYDPDGSKEDLKLKDLVAGAGTASVTLDSEGNVVFTPVSSLRNSVATFTYTVADKFGKVSAPATVTINVGTILTGSNRPDQLLGGSPGGDKISGLGGDDSLNGFQGDDQLWGGQGRDILNGGYGMDKLVGGADADRIIDPDGGTIVLESFSDSSLRAPDIIESFPSYSLRIDVPWEDKYSSISNWNWVSARSLRERDVKQAIDFLEGSGNFKTLGAVFFDVGGDRFLAIDNGDGAFSGTEDAVVALKTYIERVEIF